jgi:hypothetical protein
LNAVQETSLGTAPDPLTTSAAGTALAAVSSLLWPELFAAVVSLAVLASFLVWVRVLRALRERRLSQSQRTRLVPLLIVGGMGWSVVLLGPLALWERALFLGALPAGLWLLLRSAGTGS